VRIGQRVGFAVITGALLNLRGGVSLPEQTRLDGGGGGGRIADGSEIPGITDDQWRRAFDPVGNRIITIVTIAIDGGGGGELTEIGKTGDGFGIFAGGAERGEENRDE